MTNVKLLNQDNKLNARYSESQRDRWQDEYVHSLRIHMPKPGAALCPAAVEGEFETEARGQPSVPFSL